MRSSLQSIFKHHFARFAQGRDLHVRELRAASSIMNCHTPELGGHVVSCPSGHYSRTQYHACRHRSCPQCTERPRQQWLERQLPRLLPTEHFHAVFTLPHVFLPLWAYNRSAINQLLFDCARQSLLQLCADPRHLGATPGILMALHSWGRTLSLHPHVHCLVSAGGLDPQGQWQSCRARYLVPVKALSALFRGKLLAALKQRLGELRLHLPPDQDRTHWLACIKAQYRQHWNVQLTEPYAHGRGVALYLARYVKGGPLGADRALSCNGQSVRFDYTDHRDGQRKPLELSTAEFLARVLGHAPPRGQHLVRHCGLYASSAQHRLYRARSLLQPAAMPAPLQPSACHSLGAPVSAPALKPRCPQCHGMLERTLSLLPMHRLGEYSIRLTPHASDTGPTGRSSGQTTAANISALRRRSLRRCSPLN
jgi:hypothetical protein